MYYEDKYYVYEDIGGVTKGCQPEYFSIPVTFKNSKSFAKLTGYEGSYSMNVSLEFRTYEENGLLVYHGFSSEGFVKVRKLISCTYLFLRLLKLLNCDNFES